MAVTHTLYGLGIEKIAEQSIDWINDTIEIALCTNSYTPLQDTHEFFDDITNEVVGTGYTAFGETLGTKTITYDAGSNEVRFDAADVTWSSSTITARYAIIYKNVSDTAASSPLIGWIDFDGDEVSTNGDFTITFATNSVFKITVT